MTSTSPATPPAHQAERAKLTEQVERFLDCPTAENLAAIQSLATAYQSRWISGHAGTAAAGPTATTGDKRIPKIAFADRTVLQRLAEGWMATPADVPRWCWFEDRDLIRLEPHPQNPETEILVLTDLGRSAATGK